MKLQKKFHKRAFLEILEYCSGVVADNKKVYTVMFSVDGEIIENIDEIPDDCKVILLSENKDDFKGIQFFEGEKSIRSTKMQLSKSKP